MLTRNKLWKRGRQVLKVKSDKRGGKSTRVAFTAFLFKKSVEQLGPCGVNWVHNYWLHLTSPP